MKSRKDIIKIMLGWIENNEPIEITADKILLLFQPEESKTKVSLEDIRDWMSKKKYDRKAISGVSEIIFNFLNSLPQPKQQEHELDEDISPVERCENCHNPIIYKKLLEQQNQASDKFLEQINTLMWESFMIKNRAFGRDEGLKIMQILEKWASKTND